VNVILVGSVATAIVVVLAIFSTLPAFIQSSELNSNPKVMLSFSLIDDTNPAWCLDLAKVLQKHHIRAIVFVTGKVAESNSECVAQLASNKNLDIGSQTYNFKNLTSFSDYTEALREVQGGKKAVDAAGGVDTLSFKAPFRSTDDNIYSYLSRSGILADFSYPDHYNVYQNGLFIKFESNTFHEPKSEIQYLSDISKSKHVPVIIEFDDDVNILTIDEVISNLESAKIDSYDFDLVNASDLVQKDLTIRTYPKGEST